jgi:O-antigen/teichoic acid export membrane protein
MHMIDVSQNNKRIAKNTLLLYFRTFFIMAISLYTSRVVLNILGVENYGIYNVVGGVVAMFSVVSGALTSSISRFLTFELGKDNGEKLKRIFSTSVNIQIGISFLILLIAEPIGGWFLNTHMNIPFERIVAANWVFQCSLITFCINLISVPYNACIVAHERMSAFAYISILEATLKLLIVYLLALSSVDKLITYAVLLVCVAIVIRITYGLYCSRHFSESRYCFIYDRSILKEMVGFAGWNFFTNSIFIFNTQGVNILINLFFGVTLNAARGIATQVDAAIMQFVNNFTMALNPQIIKNYAQGNKEEMFKLVCRGAKFSYYLLLFFSLPIIFETKYILTLWLKIVPEHSVIFLRLTIIGSMINMLGNTGYIACMATGTIKRYVLWITPIGCLVFPLTWIAFELGFPVESTYIIFMIVYMFVETVRLWLMKKMLNFPPLMFIREVIIKLVITTSIAIIFPLVIINIMDSSFFRVVVSIIVGFVSVIGSIYFFGLTKHEQLIISQKMKKKICNKLGLDL